MGRPVVLVFVRYFRPGFKGGGPITTIANLVAKLGDEFDFRIVTSDRDLGGSMPYPESNAGKWVDHGKGKVLYVCREHCGFLAMARLLRNTPHDVLYLNSFFDPVYTLIPVLLRRLRLVPRTACVIAPRGEFSPGALRLKKFKKRAFLMLSRFLGLHTGVVWQASSPFEVEDIRRALKPRRREIFVAPDLPTPLPAGRSALPAGRGRAGESLRVIFLSRIDRTKNLDFALRVLAGVRAKIDFAIYGPVTDHAYWQACRALMDVLPPNVTARYKGEAHPDEVPRILAEHDLFLLPTLGENYGHAIVEALSAGTPVLISNRTPWRELEDSSAGWDLPLDGERRFVEVIEHCAQSSAKELRKLRESASAYAQARCSDPTAIAANRRLFLSLISRADTARGFATR